MHAAQVSNQVKEILEGFKLGKFGGSDSLTNPTDPIGSPRSSEFPEAPNSEELPKPISFPLHWRYKKKSVTTVVYVGKMTPFMESAWGEGLVIVLKRSVRGKVKVYYFIKMAVTSPGTIVSQKPWIFFNESKAKLMFDILKDNIQDDPNSLVLSKADWVSHEDFFKLTHSKVT